MTNSKHRKKKRKGLSSSKGPALFSEVGREAKDLLEKGYIKDHEFSITTCGSTGLSLTSTVVKHGKHSSAHLAAKHNYRNATINVSTAVKHEKHSSAHLAANYSCKNATINVKVDSKSQLSASLTFSRKFLPSTQTIASLKLPGYSSSELKLRYFYEHEHVALATSVLLNRNPEVTLSASIGTPKMAIGVEAKYKTKSCSANYSAGISVANPNCNASMILANQGDLLKASYVHHFNQPKKIAAVAEIARRFSTKENTFTVGGSFSVDHLTTVKVKLNNHGKLTTLLRHTIRPKSSFSISGELDMKALDKNPRIGLALALML